MWPAGAGYGDGGVISDAEERRVEVEYTDSLISLVKKMLISKLHCQKGFDLILFL